MNLEKRKERARRKAAHNLKMRNGNNGRVRFSVKQDAKGNTFLVDENTGKVLAVEKPVKAVA